MRRSCLALLLCITVAPSGARAADGTPWERLERALDGWRTGEARAALATIEEKQSSSPALELARGRLEFLEGHYERADRILDGAREAGPLALHLRDIARATHAQTRGYLRHATADGHFIISHEPGPDAILVPYLEETLAQAWPVLTDRLDFVPSEPIRIEIYPRVDVLAAVSPLKVEEIRTSGTIALCKYNRLMITSPRDLVYGYPWADTAVHELVHLLITQRTYNRVPIWLHEGLAKYLESAWRDASRPVLERRSEDLLARALAERSLISFEAMSPSMAKLPSQEAAATAFAEVFTVIDWLVQTHGPTAIGELLDAMANGSSDRESMELVAGVSFARFERQWRAHLADSRLRRLDQHVDMKLLFRGHDTEASELELIEAEEARRWIWLGDQLQLKERPRAAVIEYQKAAVIAGDSVPMIQAKIARMFLALGQLSQARAAIDGPLAVAPNYVLIPLLLGQISALEENHEEARGHFENVLRLNPFDIQIHGLLANTYGALGETELRARERAAQTILHKSLDGTGERP